VENLNDISIDMGTGAGFPGMALAIAGAGRMHLIESDAKKVTFLREVARITETLVIIHHQRIEEAKIDHVKHIFSRACAPLPELFSYASRYISEDAICYFHKGKNYAKELLDS